ncbi:MAG TPA: FTR1 family protein, partial [Nitrososphaeraceae archaeon]|nr:FTR1 family protein [Nitrososphaeraceae archaeon]
MTIIKLKELKKLRKMKVRIYFVVILIIIALGITLPALDNYLSYAQQQMTEELNNETVVVMVNLERIRTQLLLAEKSLNDGDKDMAFAHAFIPHSTTFPSIKNQLIDINEQFASDLEAMLIDLPINIKTANDSLHNSKLEISRINNLLNGLSSQVRGSDTQADKSLIAQIIVFLLRDAAKSYQISNAVSAGPVLDRVEKQPQPSTKQFSKVDYENALGLVNVSKSNYNKISDSLDERRKNEINSFFRQIENSISQKTDQESVLRLIAAIERDLSEELSLSEGSERAGEHTKYFSTIRTLLSNIITEVKENGDYKEADKNAITAYLDNYEYLEAPIEKHDPQLMVDIEIDMREELRQMLRERESPENLESFINGILEKIDIAEDLLKNDPSFNQLQESGNNTSANSGVTAITDIQDLSKGFGVYTGERKEMGEAQDSAKEAVRNNIDQIRKKLDQMLLQYKAERYNEALSTSRSAYLDSYENIEIPLRPIDPDFTLEMEIKFAELRNLIQSQSPYEEIESKTVEIRNGLDESERLVSGTGIVAPTIAFSTSFSIIFREGLESALIIGAILTYLEASRNQRFKKHIYYGIVLAAAATGVTWFIAEYIIEISGASRELIEAIAGISAVAVLFWVSFWVLNRIETKKWIEFVKAKVWKATTTGGVTVFIMLSFFTVYREGFETVLFYQAMLSFAKYMEWYVIAGMIFGLTIIVGIVFLIRKLGKKLPLRVLFGLTMGVGAYMSIAFMGNAIREFQEVGYISTTHMFGTIPRLDINLATMTGIHPTLETIVAQFILLSIYIVGSLYVLIIQPRRKKKIETVRKSMADVERKKI